MASKQTGAAPFLRAVTEFIFQEDAPQKAQVIFVPGSNQPQHALKAAELYHAGFAPFVLPSGRFAKPVGHFAGVEAPWQDVYAGAYETEWAFLRDVLTRAGVPDSAVLREDQATYTWENAQYSQAVTDQMGLKVEIAILCCKPFHARRALMYYQAAFPETEILVCPARWPGVDREDWFLTKEGFDTVMGEVARCGAQVNEVLLDAMAAQGIITKE